MASSNAILDQVRYRRCVTLDSVAWLKDRLNRYFESSPKCKRVRKFSRIDNDFEEFCESRVKAFQKAERLQATGRMGDEDWARLIERTGGIDG